LRIQERPFQVDAKQARQGRLQTLPRGLHRPGHVPSGVRDEGRKKAGRAKATVGSTDLANSVDSPGFVEKRATAAVHLHVDESRCQQTAYASGLDSSADL